MTTSETGSRTGFTLIEVLVVVSLMSLLIAALVAAVLNVGQRAYISATTTLLERIDLGVDRYKDLTGFYPADGLDGDVVKSREGTEIVSSACLYEFLGRPLQIIKVRPGGLPKVERFESPVLRGLKEEELERHPLDRTLAEIVDAWRIPLHYDRLQGDESYSVQDTPEIHLDPPEFHGPDPREVSGIAVSEAGVGQNPGSYDVWSHGTAGHDTPAQAAVAGEEELLKYTIGNWEQPEE